MRLLADISKEIDENKINLKIFKLHKSYLLLISDQEEMGIGSVTLASPPTVKGLKSTVASYNLFGIEDKLLSTIISERTSNKLGKPVLVLLFLKTIKREKEIAKPIINLLNETLNQIMEHNDK